MILLLQNYWVLKNGISVNLGQLTHNIVSSINSLADILSALEINPKMVEESLIDLLLGTNSIILYYARRVGGDNHKITQNKKIILFYYI